MIEKKDFVFEEEEAYCYTNEQLVELVSRLQPVRMRTCVQILGSALIGRGDNLVYVGNTPTPRVRIKSSGDLIKKKKLLVVMFL